MIPVHVVPETGSDERMHVLDHVGACWCRPLNEFIPDRHDGGRNQWRITHRGAGSSDTTAGGGEQ